MEKPTSGGLKCFIWAINHKSSIKIGFIAQCELVPIVKKRLNLLGMVYMSAKTLDTVSVIWDI